MPTVDAETWQFLLSTHKSFIVLFVAAAACTFAGTPIHILLARRFGWVDRPGGRKNHAAPTPTMGGVVIFLTTFCGIGITLMWGNRVTLMLSEHLTYVIGALACTFVAIVVGVIDDLRRLRPKVLLVTQVVIAVAAYFIGFRTDAITLPLIGSTELGGLSFALTLVWIIGVINAVNFSDGMDGLAGGIGLLAAATNAGVAIWLGNYYMAVMMLVLSGALLGFLPWNTHPARVFLGNAGSFGLGTFLALCSLHSAQKSHTAVMILVPLCALGYPLFDMMLAVARRTLRGQPPWTSDRDHVHHRLLARGHSPRQAVTLIYAASLALIAACLFAMSTNHMVVGVSLIAVVLLAFFSVRVLGYLESGLWSRRHGTKILHAAAQLAILKLKSARDVHDVVSALGLVADEIGIAELALRRNDQSYQWQSARNTATVPECRTILPGGWTLGIQAKAHTSLALDDELVWDRILDAANATLNQFTDTDSNAEATGSQDR